jgi:SAM-dependent methyltransferase
MARHADPCPHARNGAERSGRVLSRPAGRAKASLQRQDWNDLALVDPLWAIFSAPGKRHGRWSADEFFQTGEAEIAEVMSVAAELGLPEKFRRALDFGCGVGRATRALSFRFAEALGIDISERMIELAHGFNVDRPNCIFLASDSSDLSYFDSKSFDLVYSNVVLQHLPGAESVYRYIAEFMRVVDDRGLVVFQMPFRLRWRARAQPKRRLYRTLRRLGANPRALYKAGLSPMRTSALAEAAVTAAVERSGGQIMRAAIPVQPNPSKLYFVRRSPHAVNHISQSR